MVVVKAIEQEDDGYAPIDLLLDNIALLCNDFTSLDVAMLEGVGIR